MTQSTRYSHKCARRRAASTDVAASQARVGGLAGLGAVVPRAAPLSCADKAPLSDETIEDRKRFCPIQSRCGADVAVADGSGFGELGDNVGEFLRAELETSGWSERPAESVASAATLAVLFQESLIAQTMQYVAGGVRVDCGELANAFVRERLAACGMHERNAIEPAKGASPFEFVDPRALGGRDGAADRQFHNDLMAAVAKTGRLKHLRSHRVLHDVDAPTNVLGQTKSAEHADNDEVARGIRLSDVLDGDRLGQPARRGTTTAEGRSSTRTAVPAAS